MAKMAKVGAVGLVALGLVAVKMSNTFSTEMLKIRTEGGATSKEFNTMRAAVINLANSGASMGQTTTQLAMGLYHLESMGIRGKKAILGLKLASEEAAISGAHLEDTTTAIGGAMFVALKGTGSMAHMMGTLNAIAGSGNMRFQDLNEALGTGLLSSAKVAGVSLQEVGAALSVLTDSGQHASSAGAQLATALHYLYAPTAKAQTALASIGLSGGKLAADLRKPQGILAALRDLRDHMAGLSPTAQSQVLSSILPGGRGRVLLSLYEMQKRLAPKYGQIAGTSGDFNQHVAEQKKNPATKLKTGVSELSGYMTTLGDDLKKYVMPVAQAFLTTLAKLLVAITSVFVWFVKGTPLARALTMTIAGLAAGLLAFVTVTKIATVAQAAFDAVMDANPITLVIVALAALAVGVIYAYNKFKWFRDLVNGVWSWLKGAVVATVGFVKKHWLLIAEILTLPFGGFIAFIATHFGEVKKIVIGIVNWIIGAINTVIGAIDSIHVTLPFGAGTIGFNIGKIPLIGGGGGSPSKSVIAQRGAANRYEHSPSLRAAQVTHHFATNQLQHAQNRPAIVHGDIVLKVRGQEIGRVTRRELHKAMAG
jgi:TP901 family phage tail tape measure protein